MKKVWKVALVPNERRRYATDPEFRAKKDAKRRASVAKVRVRVGRKTGGLYRSEMEARVAPPVLESGGEYEPLRLQYQSKPRGYTPDFVLPNGIAIEVKGWFPACDRSKMLAVKAAYPALDLRMVLASPHQFITSRKICTQSQWCDRNGIKWAENVVPAEWFAEPTNAASKAILDRAPRVKRGAR